MLDGSAAVLARDVALGLTVGPLEQGFVVDGAEHAEGRVAVIQAALIGERVRQDRHQTRATENADAVVRSLSSCAFVGCTSTTASAAISAWRR